MLAGSGWAAAAAATGSAGAVEAVLSARSKSCTLDMSEPPHDKQNLFVGGLLAPHEAHVPGGGVAAVLFSIGWAAGAVIDVPHDRQNLLVDGLLAPHDGHTAP